MQVDMMQELWITGRRTGRYVATGRWDWQLCPDLAEGPYASVLVDGRWVGWESSWGRSCSVPPLQTLPGEERPAGRSHAMVTASLGKSKRELDAKGPAEWLRPRTLQPGSVQILALSADTSVNLRQMIKVPLLCLVSSSVKPQQDYSVVRIIGSNYHKGSWDDWIN